MSRNYGINNWEVNKRNNPNYQNHNSYYKKIRFFNVINQNLNKHMKNYNIQLHDFLFQNLFKKSL